MAQQTKAGSLLTASAATGRASLKLPQVPSVIVLFINITGTVTYNIELRDGTGNYIPVRTLTANAIVKVAVPATEIAVNVTANTGTITANYRSVVLDTIPNVGIEVFTAGSIEPQTVFTLNTETKPDIRKSLAQGQLLTTSATLYTVPAGIQTRINSMFLVNNDVIDVSATLSINGAATSAANLILPATPIKAGGFAQYEGEIDLDPTDTIRGLASVASKITYTITGREIST
jgi:hypothetical protein